MYIIVFGGLYNGNVIYLIVTAKNVVRKQPHMMTKTQKQMKRTRNGK